MKIKVVYHSNHGNTQKIAESLAESIGVKAEPISSGPDISGVDILFVGGSLKMYTLEGHCRKFFKSLKKPGMAKNVAVFSTSLSGNGILNYAKQMIKAKDIRIYDNEYKCLGSIYMDTNKEHPDAIEILGAKEFAAKAVKELTAGL
jgi:flavodoxin